MFVGAAPKPVIEQITRVVPFGEWGKVFVGCSGSFRFDRAVKQRHWKVEVHSNDVSLLSCGLGALATGKTFDLTFKDRLRFMQTKLKSDDFRGRVAAVMVALQMAKHKGDNPRAVSHFRHYQNNFDRFLDGARDKLDGFLEGLAIESFTAGNFNGQVARAVAEGGGVAAFPPTYKGGYERIYKFLDEHTDWPAPDYELWDPAGLEGWVQDLDSNGVRYCVISDRLFESLEPVAVFRGSVNKPIYAYADSTKASVKGKQYRSAPFGYTVVDPAALTAAATVKIVRAKSEHMNFLKDRYLAKGIQHVTGMDNFLVYLDDHLAGGFILNRPKFGEQDSLYLLSDFALAWEPRLSKLIAMLATSREIVQLMERKLLIKVKRIKTTAFTDKPISMKYRGVYELTARKAGFLNYASGVREQSPQDIYGEWFQKHAQGQNPGGAPGRPAAA